MDDRRLFTAVLILYHAHYLGTLYAGVVIECVGGDDVGLGLQCHVIEETGFLRVHVITSPVAVEPHALGLVHKGTAFSIVNEVEFPVQIQAVGGEHRGLVMGHLHIFPGIHHLHIGAAVVEGIVAHQLQGVALQHAHMAESLKRVGILIEVGAVARQPGARMAEPDIALHYLHPSARILIIRQVVGMLQEDTFVIVSLGLQACRHKQVKQAQNHDNDSMPARYNGAMVRRCHLTQP